MSDLNIDNNLKAQLLKLEKKYEAMGQNLSSYLDGLLYADYLTYWDYIHLDTLLSLQAPRTAFPDEKIFILYHQITELYFRLILNELEQIVEDENPSTAVFLKRINRINRYFDHLIDSFDVMIDGMDAEQFHAFRMSLLPSSGFQSAQYRFIEIYATDFYLLTKNDIRDKVNDTIHIDKLYENLYWKSGATELATGKKTLTLKQFEKKYKTEFLSLGNKLQTKNLRKLYANNFEADEEIKTALKQLDHKMNVDWPLQHLKSATRYLNKSPEAIKATGGTNWQKYLPPRIQRVVFYPELWSKKELSEWGQKFKLLVKKPND